MARGGGGTAGGRCSADRDAIVPRTRRRPFCPVSSLVSPSSPRSLLLRLIFLAFRVQGAICRRCHRAHGHSHVYPAGALCGMRGRGGNSARRGWHGGCVARVSRKDSRPDGFRLLRSRRLRGPAFRRHRGGHPGHPGGQRSGYRPAFRRVAGEAAADLADTGGFCLASSAGHCADRYADAHAGPGSPAAADAATNPAAHPVTDAAQRSRDRQLLGTTALARRLPG